MIYHADRLWDLLPVLLRERDAEEGYPLRALLRIVAKQAGLLERDIETLYDDLFVETARPWVIPYIGDLVGNRALSDSSRLSDDETARELFPDLVGPNLRAPIAIRTRADVAKTIYYRRRKGTLPMLEELARDVTGWPAHAVEFFELLGWNQHLEHYRPQSRWADVRSVDRCDRAHSAFDEFMHWVDVRRIGGGEGWHNIKNVGFFLYRLQSYELERVPAREGDEPWRYHFSPLGNPAPLFSRWRREGDETGLASELHVAAPIRAALFYEDLERYARSEPNRPDYTDLYGLPEPIEGDPTDVCPECSFVILHDGTPVIPAIDPTAPPDLFAPRIVCRRLDPWPTARPAGSIVTVDVESGRLALGSGFDESLDVDVYYHYGFPADLGGGPYERHKWLIRSDTVEHELFVREGIPVGSEPNTHPSVISALTEWSTTLARADTVITILDNRTYRLPGTIAIPNEVSLAIQAANGRRPLLQTVMAGLDVQTLPPDDPADPDRQASLTFGGVVVEGHVRVTGDLGRLRFIHSTLVPGRRLEDDGTADSAGASVRVSEGTTIDPLNTQLRIESAFSILGRLEVPEHAEGVWVLDGIVDALGDDQTALQGPNGGPGPDAWIERSTIIGRLGARSLYLSESIVTGQVQIERTQTGCVRFSIVPPGSRTPRRFRCQPDLASQKALEEALERDPLMSDPDQADLVAAVQRRVVPAFTTRLYGRPVYLQLRRSAAEEIQTGAEDGSEMGAYCHVKQPQRVANLRLRLEEYLPFGLEAGVVFAT